MARKSRRKHANGEGGRTIRKGGLRQYTFYVRQPDGTKRRVYHYCRDQAEGEAWLAEMRLRAAKGELLVESDTSLADYIDQWVKGFCINLRPSTRGSYELYLRHIRQHPIGKTPLRKLTTSQIQDYIRFLLADGRLDGEGGLSEKTVRNLVQMLTHALKQAVGCNLIARNPADFIVLPTLKR